MIKKEDIKGVHRVRFNHSKIPKLYEPKIKIIRGEFAIELGAYIMISRWFLMTDSIDSMKLFIYDNGDKFHLIDEKILNSFCYIPFEYIEPIEKEK